MIVFEAWEDKNGITFSTQDNIFDHKNNELLSYDAEFIHEIRAENYREGMVLHHQKMGWAAYKE